MAINSTDPLVWKRDECGDLIIPLQRAFGLDAVATLVRCAVMLFRDEWFLNRDAGMPWLATSDGAVSEQQAILGSIYDSAKAREALRAQILKVTAVRGVSQLRTAFDGVERALSVSCVVQSTFGDVPINTTLTVG